jgi:hypothetical protein
VLPHGSAGQQQIGNVDAGDEQHEADRAGEDEQRGARAGHQVVLQRLELDAPIAIIGILRGEVAGDDVHLRLRLLDRNAGFEPRDGIAEVVRARDTRVREEIVDQPHVH